MSTVYLSNAFDALLQPKVLWTVLWCGFALLTFAMAILAQTRWGQGKTIAKCMVLSVLAHVLLMGYAYTTQLFFDSPFPGPGDQPFEVTLLDISESSDQTNEATETQPTRTQPWEIMPSELPDIPLPKPPPRTEMPPQNLPLPEPSQFSVKGNPSMAQSLVASAQKQISPPKTAPADPLFAPNPQSVVQRSATIEAPIFDEPPLPKPEMTVSEVPFERPVMPEKFRPRINQMTDKGNRFKELAKATLPTDRPNSPQDPTPSETSRSGIEASFAAYASGGETAAAATAQPAAEVDRRRIDGSATLDDYKNRVAQNRGSIAKHFGGDQKTEEAVNAALAWLVKNQQKDGSWNPRATGAGHEAKVAGRDRSGAGSAADSGVTALAVLALMGAGHTHLQGEHRVAVQHGLEYLMKTQKSNGCLSGKAQLYAAMYCHGMASLALSEAYAMTGDERLKTTVQRAVAYTIAAQHPVNGGWRYRPGDVGDMSQFGWQVMALRSAELAGIEIPDSTRFAMRRFLRSCSSGRYSGLASYRPNEKASPSMTAEALACRYFLDTARSPEAVKEATDYLAKNPPGDGRPNLYYWYYGAIALHQTQSDTWRTWNGHLKRRLLALQDKSTTANAGSWAPDSTWGSHGGRVYSTALGALCLEVYYRYLPLTKK